MTSFGSTAFPLSELAARWGRAAPRGRLVLTLAASLCAMSAGISKAGPAEPETADGAGPITWTLWLGPIAPREEPVAPPLDRQAWMALLRSLAPDVRSDVEHAAREASGVLAALRDGGPRPADLSTELGTITRGRPDPVYRLIALRALSQASLDVSTGADPRETYQALVEVGTARTSACDRAIELLDHPSAPVVVGYADACLTPPAFARRASAQVAAGLRRAVGRVPVERWALPFWRAVFVVATADEDDALREGSAAAIAVIEDRACQGGCDRLVERAAAVEVQRALYGCAARAGSSGLYDLASSDHAFAVCVTDALPAARRSDRVVVWRAPFD